MNVQPAILNPVSRAARYLSFSLRSDVAPAASRHAVQLLSIDDHRVVLNFVAFGYTLDSLEVQLTRMVDLEDGIPDAVFRFSRPITGGYYWCPPVRDGRLGLRAFKTDSVSR